MADQLYNLTNIRTLLVRGFSDVELRRLCFDVPGFHPVYDNLAAKTGKAEIVDQLLEYAQRQMQMEVLLDLARKQNPTRYEAHAPYILDGVLHEEPATQKKRQHYIALNWARNGRQESLSGFDLRDADLRRVDFAGADLSRTDFSRANLYLANLSLTNLEGTCLQETDLRKATLDFANLRGANIDKRTQIDKKWYLVWEIVNQGGLNRPLSGQDMNRANLSEVNLTGANLSSAKLSHANLKGANLSRANLTDADLHWANLHQVIIDQYTRMDRKWGLVWDIVNNGGIERDLSLADLRGVNLRGADLRGADLRGANLLKADLTGANLAGADLTRVWGVSVNLSRADLSDATLIEAKLDDSDLTGADLTRANLTKVSWARARRAGAIMDSANLDGVMAEQGGWKPVLSLLAAATALVGLYVAEQNRDTLREYWDDISERWKEQEWI